MFVRWIGHGVLVPDLGTNMFYHYPTNQGGKYRPPDKCCQLLTVEGSLPNNMGNLYILVLFDSKTWLTFIAFALRHIDFLLYLSFI